MSTFREATIIPFRLRSSVPPPESTGPIHLRCSRCGEIRPYGMNAVELDCELADQRGFYRHVAVFSCDACGRVARQVVTGRNIVCLGGPLAPDQSYQPSSA